jgi:hypothetical protein
MEQKNLKSKYGQWLTIDELRSLLSETPEEICEQVPINRRLLEIASEFVEKQGGWWEHPQWEGFLAKLIRDGFHLSKEVEPPIGSILEIFKAYYQTNRFEAIVAKRSKPTTRKTAPSGKTRLTNKNQTVKQA